MKKNYKIEEYEWKKMSWFPIRTYRTPHAAFNAMKARKNASMMPFRCFYKDNEIMNTKSDLTTQFRIHLRCVKLKRILKN